MGWRTKLKRGLRIRNRTVREFLAELLGTFTLVAFGNGSVAQYVLSNNGLGSFLSINWGFGIGAMLGVYVSCSVSGGHINPAVTLAMALLGRIRWWKSLVYMLAQYLGAFLAAACIYGVYLDALDNFDGGIRQVSGVNATAGIFGTFPQEYVSMKGALADQIFATGLLTLCILGITDPKNTNPPKGLIPVAVGFVVMVIGAAYGLNCGFAVNPARDLGPRLFTLLAGWGVEVFSFRDYGWFWIPIAGPYIGGVLGALVYQVFVGIHWAEDEDEDATFGESNAFHNICGEFHKSQTIKM